jgi:5-methylcytosine-specific restriction endonuclease McrA
MSKRNSPMTLEQCAERMTRFLERKPRSGKTRAYVASLPKRPKVTVSPQEYATPISRAEAKANGVVKLRDAQRYAAWEARGKPPSPTVPPKARSRRRLRPIARDRFLIEEMADAQGGRCVLCGWALIFDDDLPDHAPQRASFDHVIPRSRGGANHGNRLAAHRKCNTEKGSRMPTGCELVWLAAVNAKLGIDPASEPVIR